MGWESELELEESHEQDPAVRGAMVLRRP